MKPADIAIATLVMLIWGVTFAVAKAGLAELPPILMMALRFSVVAVLLVPFVRRPAVPLVKVIALSMTLGVLHFSLFFTGLNGVEASTAAIVIQIQVPFSVMAAAALYGERPGRRRVLGMALAFAGVAVIFAAPDSESRLPSLLLILAAALVWVLANFQIKAMGPVNVLSLNAWLALFAAPQLLLVSLLLEHGQEAALAAADWRGYGAVLYMALLATIVAYGLWYHVIGRYPMSVAMPFTLLAPVFGVASGVMFLGDAMSWRMIVGGLATVGGIAIIVLRRPHFTPSSTPPADKI